VLCGHTYLFPPYLHASYRCIVENKEPFAHKEWRKQPFEPRSYVVLSDFAITTNVAQEVRPASSIMAPEQ